MSEDIALYDPLNPPPVKKRGDPTMAITDSAGNLKVAPTLAVSTPYHSSIAAAIPTTDFDVRKNTEMLMLQMQDVKNLLMMLLDGGQPKSFVELAPEIK